MECREELLEGFARSDGYGVESAGGDSSGLHMAEFMRIYREELEDVLAAWKDPGGAGGANWGGLGGVEMQLTREREVSATELEVEWIRSLESSSASIQADLTAIATLSSDQEGVRDWVTAVVERVSLGEGRQVYQAERVSSMAAKLQQAERETGELRVVLEEASLEVALHEAGHKEATKALEKAKNSLKRLENENSKLQRELQGTREEASKTAGAFAKVARRADSLQAEVDSLSRSEASLTKQVMELNDARNSLQVRLKESESEFRKMAQVVGEKSASDDALGLLLEEKRHLQEACEACVEVERVKRADLESTVVLLEASLLDHARRLQELNEDRDELESSLDHATSKWESAMTGRDEARRAKKEIAESRDLLAEKLTASEQGEAGLRREMAKVAADQKTRQASAEALGVEAALQEEAERLRGGERRMQEELRGLRQGVREREARWEAEKAANLRRIREHARIKVEQGVKLQMVSRKAQMNEDEFRDKVARLERSLTDAEELVRELTRLLLLYMDV